MILVTTSDYYPKMGGLSTFTSNIEKVLAELGQDYEVFHWKNRHEIKRISADKLQSYTHIINIHPQFCWEQSYAHQRVINFIHGSECLMTSPDLLKRIVKSFKKKEYFSRLEQAFLNVFISEATFKKTVARGFAEDYSRDLIMHNCIDTQDAEYIEKEITSDWVFSCIVRDVPHKNLTGTALFCEKLKKLSGKNIELIVPETAKIESGIIQITKLKSNSNECRNQAYQRSHFNLLFSLDHSQKGYYEGFGLTVLEASMFGTPSLVLGTGGLPEAVHHLKTGWVFESLEEKYIGLFLNQLSPEQYKQISKECFEHTLQSHSLKEYSRLLNIFIHEEGDV